MLLEVGQRSSEELQLMAYPAEKCSSLVTIGQYSKVVWNSNLGVIPECKCKESERETRSECPMLEQQYTDRNRM